MVFLTSKYQRRYSLFETERLIRSHAFCVNSFKYAFAHQRSVSRESCLFRNRTGPDALKPGGRKTLFTFIGALLPIASSPALQMGCLGEPV